MRAKIYAAAILAGGLGLASHPLQAEWYPKEFSASVQWTIPPGSPNAQGAPGALGKIQGKVFVGNLRMRIESTSQGITRALIVIPEEKKAWTLDLTGKTYHEGVGRVALLPKPDSDILPSEPDSPCAQKDKFSCNKTGSDTLEGVAVEKWVIDVIQGEQKGQTTLWIDPKRHLVLKQQPKNGPLQVRTLLGDVEWGGRPAEKWKLSEDFQGRVNTMEQWVDKELRLVVKQSGQSVDFLVIQGIQIGPQPDQLFRVPEGFKLTPLPVANPPSGQR